VRIYLLCECEREAHGNQPNNDIRARNDQSFAFSSRSLSRNQPRYNLSSPHSTLTVVGLHPHTNTSTESLMHTDLTLLVGSTRRYWAAPRLSTPLIFNTYV